MRILAIAILIVLLSCINGQYVCPDADPGLLPWSNPSSWTSGQVPQTNEAVVIPPNKRILLDVSPPPLLSITIQSQGALVWKHVDGIELQVDNIQISGAFIIGSEACTFVKKAIITLTGKLGTTATVYNFGSKFIGVLSGGTLEIHGKAPSPSWTNLIKSIPKPTSFTDADLIINLAQPVSWQPGDQIVLGTTDFTYLQSEVVNLTRCPECAPNQVKMASRPLYSHYGEISYGVDERAEVGLLTRSVLIRGKMESICYGAQKCTYFNFDAFGGHLKVITGFEAAHIENAEFSHMGQQQDLAFYPIHFHNVGEVGTKAYVKNNAIHHSYSRCVTIHGTNGLPVIGNVAFDAIGHCYFIEDGVEVRNILDGNLGLLTRYGSLLPTDRECSVCAGIHPTDYNGNPTGCAGCNALATFWVTNPNNILRNNVAGGCPKAGIWYVFPEHPTGDWLSATNVWPQQTPLGEFYNNKAHSNGENGMVVDNMIQRQPQSAAFPQEYLSLSFGAYRPRVTPGVLNSEFSIAVFNKYITYRNRWRGAWVRGGEIRFNNSVFAENVIGVTLASEGYFPIDHGSSQDVINSLFVAETDNVGMQTHDVAAYNGRTLPAGWYDSPRGFEIYDGPLSITNSKFVNYVPNSMRNAMGITWMRFDEWQLSPANYVQGLSFSPDNSLRINKIIEQPYDGTKNIVIQDKDGSLTGIAKSNVVNYTPFFFNTQNCTYRSAENVAICVRQKYAQVFVDNLNTIYNGGAAGVFWVRDEQSSFRHVLDGLPANPRIAFITLVQLYKSYTLHFRHPSPPKIFITQSTWDKGDYIRLGVCYPRNANITVRYRYHGIYTPLTQVSTQAQLSSSTFYFDQSTGLVFVLLVQQETRSGWAQVCATTDTACEGVEISAAGPGMGTNTGDCTAAAYPQYDAPTVDPPVYSTCGGIPNLAADACGVCGGDGSTCRSPTTPTSSPTAAPTSSPTAAPTSYPTAPPTTPTSSPTIAPTTSPTTRASSPPTSNPTIMPTPPKAATSAPTSPSTSSPTLTPTTPSRSPTPTSPAAGVATLKVQFHSGSSVWWWAVAVLQANGDVTSVAVRDSSTTATGSWKELDSTNWGYWIYSTNGQATVLPLYFRVTSSSGKAIQFTSPQLTPNAIVDSSQQF